MKYNIIIMMVIVILCYPLLLAKVKEYAVTIAIHNCTCHCCYLGLSCKRALGTNATKCSHGLNCYWLGWKSRRYLYIDNGMQLCLSYFLPLHAPPSGGTAGYRGATVSGLHGVVCVPNHADIFPLTQEPTMVLVCLPSMAHAHDLTHYCSWIQIIMYSTYIPDLLDIVQII